MRAMAAGRCTIENRMRGVKTGIDLVTPGPPIHEVDKRLVSIGKS